MHHVALACGKEDVETDQVAYIEVKRIRKLGPASREIEFDDLESKSSVSNY